MIVHVNVNVNVNVRSTFEAQRMRKTRPATIAILLFLGITSQTLAQGVLTPPPYERGRAGLYTIQTEHSLRLNDVSGYDGSWALRVRQDHDKWAIGGMVGAAFAGDAAALFGLTTNIKLFGESASLSRWVGGVTVNGTTVSINDLRTTTLSAGFSVGHEQDTAGFGRSIMLGARGGYRIGESNFDEGYWGASLAGTIGIQRRFQLFAQVDYASVAEFNDSARWSLGSGLRVRIGPG
jgi:hypothetical protein